MHPGTAWQVQEIHCGLAQIEQDTGRKWVVTMPCMRAPKSWRTSPASSDPGASAGFSKGKDGKCVFSLGKGVVGELFKRLARGLRLHGDARPASLQDLGLP